MNVENETAVLGKETRKDDVELASMNMLLSVLLCLLAAVPQVGAALPAANPFAEPPANAANAANPFMRAGSVGAHAAETMLKKEKAEQKALARMRLQVTTTEEVTTETIPEATDAPTTQHEVEASQLSDEEKASSAPTQGMAEVGAVAQGPPPLPLAGDESATTTMASAASESPVREELVETVQGTTVTNVVEASTAPSEEPVVEMNTEEIVALEKRTERKELKQMKRLVAEKTACATAECRAAIERQQAELEQTSEKRERLVEEAVKPLAVGEAVVMPNRACELPATGRAITDLLPQIKKSAEKVAHMFVGWESKLSGLKEPIDTFLQSSDILSSVESVFAKIDGLMTPLTMIPKIGMVLSKLQKYALRPIKKTISKIEAPIRKLRDRLAAGKAKLDVASAKFEEARKKAEEAAMRCSEAVSQLELFRSRVGTMKCAGVGKLEALVQQMGLEHAAKLLTGLAKTSLGIGGLPTGGLAAVRKGLEKMGKPMRKVKGVLDKLDKMLAVKIPILVPRIRYKVVKLFRKRIRIPYPWKERKSFTPRGILNTLNKLGPIKDLLEKAAMLPLKPVMKIVEKAIRKPFEAIEKKLTALTAKLTAFATKAASAVEGLSAVKSRLTDLAALPKSLTLGQFDAVS